MKYPQYVMVSGCFEYEGVEDLVILPKNETVNKEAYCIPLNEVLESSFEMSNTSIFQQEGTPAHTPQSLLKGSLGIVGSSISLIGQVIPLTCPP